MEVIEDMFTSFRAKNVPLFVDGQEFYEPLHYGKIMGYDKPYKPLQIITTHNDTAMNCNVLQCSARLTKRTHSSTLEAITKHYRTLLHTTSRHYKP